MAEVNSIQMMVVYENQWWVGIFERVDASGYSVAREIFGAEPTDPEIYEFILCHQSKLKFTRPLDTAPTVVRRLNPKRRMREAKRQQSEMPNTTKAQDALRIEQEKNKKERKVTKSKEKEEEKQLKFDMKQQKKKEKQRGH